MSSIEHDNNYHIQLPFRCNYIKNACIVHMTGQVPFQRGLLCLLHMFEVENMMHKVDHGSCRVGVVAEIVIVVVEMRCNKKG